MFLSLNKRQVIGFILLCLAKGIRFWSNFWTSCPVRLIWDNNPELQYLMTYRRVYLQLILVSLLRFPSSKNIWVKAHPLNITVKAHNLKGSIPRTCQKVFQVLEKFPRLQRECPWWRIFFIKLQICSIFTRLKQNFKF